MNEESDIVQKNEELNVVKYKKENIKNLIYTVRGKQVMLDSDGAQLYQCETKYINRVVKRNIERFPKEFCFQLKQEEFHNLRCQFVTSSCEGQNYGGRRYMPYVFTEQGIAMLSSLLKSNIAIKVSVNIMKAFIEMRKFLIYNAQVFERLTNVEYKLLEHDHKFDEVFNELQKNKEEKFKQKIYFKGQIYDAYSLIIDIIKEAQEKIIIIDNYIDDTILKILTKKNKRVRVVILTSNKNNISKIAIEKFNKQYPILEIAITNKFHDRFILIDDKELYHIGASLKDLGKKCFAISKIDDERYIGLLLKNR